MDYCPRCGGVWLDGGELQKLIRNVKEYEAEYRSERDYVEFEHRYRERKRKKSFFEFIEDLFEFG